MDYKGDNKLRWLEKNEGPGCFQQFYDDKWNDIPVVKEGEEDSCHSESELYVGPDGPTVDGDQNDEVKEDQSGGASSQG